MFTYLNPDVRKRLIADGKLVRVNSEGQLIDVATPESPGELAINLLGPIPLPMSLPGVKPRCNGMPLYAVPNSSRSSPWQLI